MEGKRKIIWAPSALRDLEDIFDFIRLDQPSRAKSLIEHVVQSAGRLARFPKLGRFIPEIGESRYRELLVGDYRVFHEVREKEILIFRVFHSRRFFPE